MRAAESLTARAAGRRRARIGRAGGLR